MAKGKFEAELKSSISSNDTCIAGQLSCSSSSWMVDETLCCDSATEICKLAPYIGEYSTLLMPFCCPKSSNVNQPCTNQIHGNLFSPPPCPTTPVPHKRCNHNVNKDKDGRFGVSWCCPDIPGVECGDVDKICLYNNPIGGNSRSTSGTLLPTSTGVVAGGGTASSTYYGTAGASTGTNGPVPSSSSKSSSEGLSTAAKAGIVTSLVALALFAVVAGMILLKRRKRLSHVKLEEK